MTAGDTPADTDEIVTECVERLRSFELTEYEARCFVALTRIGTGTAKDVSEVADVPQARVYDCMDTLQEREIVDIQQGTPREFRAADADEALDALERHYTTHLDRLEELLPRLESPARQEDSGDVWMLEGDAAVSERASHLVEEAEQEVLVAVAVEDLLTDDLLGALQQAADRGVTVLVGSPSAAIRDRIDAAVDGARVVETWTWWETHPIQPGAISAIVMVDGRAMLASADIETSLPGVRRHRAVWADSDTAPLVGIMRPLLAEAIGGRGGDAVV
jgi:sugar-specific transcriptional regulator TrmB